MKPTINLDAIMTAKGLNPRDLETVLFPKNKYPRQALHRLRTGVKPMNADQIARLAAFLRCEAGDLFNGGWKVRSIKNKHHTFIRIDNRGKKYKAILDLEYGRTYLYADEHMLCETMLHSKTVTLSEYFLTLDRLIKKTDK